MVNYIIYILTNFFVVSAIQTQSVSFKNRYTFSAKKTVIYAK